MHKHSSGCTQLAILDLKQEEADAAAEELVNTSIGACLERNSFAWRCTATDKAVWLKRTAI
jgi:hypothetical protein